MEALKVRIYRFNPEQDSVPWYQDSVFRCWGIGNCTAYCPKGLNPMKAIGHIKTMLVKTRG